MWEADKGTAGAAVEVRVNGREMRSDQTTLHALRASLYAGAEGLVTILNGYQTQEDLPLKNGDEIVWIEKGKPPTRGELEHMLTARLTPGVYDKVRRARVGVAGLGGLGSSVALSLARTGVGHLHLVDFDVVEPSNLNRQQYRLCHLGMPKVEALRQEIEEVNPFVQVRTECARVDMHNAAQLFCEDDIVCEAFDNPVSKAALVNAMLEQCPGKPVVAASGMAGSGSANTIRTRRVSGRLYLCGDGETGAQPGRGLMAPRVGVCAGHQANMVLRLILGEEEA